LNEAAGRGSGGPASEAEGLLASSACDGRLPMSYPFPLAASAARGGCGVARGR